MGNKVWFDFYQALGVIGGDDKKEQKEMHKVSQRLVMPVVGLFELNDILEKALKAIKERGTTQKSSAN